MGIFVTGADTGVGKTVVSAWIALKMGWKYFKPIQTGYSNGAISDTEFVTSMGVEAYPERYRLQLPLAPYVAAGKEGVSFNLKTLCKPPAKDGLVVEGAGGVLVPITVNFDMIDLIKVLGFPVLLVTKASLGTINHTRLTLQMLSLRGIEVIGVVMVGMNNDNKVVIEKFSGVRVFLQMPNIEKMDRASLEALEMDSDMYKILSFTNVHS